ncbi:MAG: class A beta-lactamase-related serine hydrolase [Spirochaetia bacterium]|nr:class A beta-lactamase-related serine hydrolase [Spirochaetia bacterium]
MKYLLSKAYSLVACALVLVLAGCTTTGSQQPSDIGPALQQLVETQYGQFRETYNLPDHLGMLLFMHTPKGDFTAQAGFPDDGYDEDTHYRIASVTKTFTAASIMLLDQAGALDIEDTVTDTIMDKGIRYLPDTDEYAIPYKEEITIRDLLAHRAGIFDVFNDPIPEESQQSYAGMNYVEYIMETEDTPHQFSFAEMASVLAKNQLSYGRPGSLYHYSDLGYMLLAVIIERVSGMPYSQFLEEHFFTPMLLQNTTSVNQADDTGLPDPYFTGYSRWDAGYFETTEDNLTSNIGAGNIISTPRDMAHWIRGLLAGKGSLSPAQIQRMKMIPEGNISYALGISKTPVGIGHSGAHPGYLNFVQYNEEHDVALVVVAPFLDYDAGSMDHISAVSQCMLAIMEGALRLYDGN